jgi:DNA-binding MarR family transcriptional regulator
MRPSGPPRSGSNCAIKLIRAILACVQATISPRVETLTGDLYALIVYLHKHCNKDLFEAVGALEVSLSQLKLLHHLEAAATELTLKQAAESVHVSFPAASRMVDDLVRRGFVARHEDAGDRRMKRVSITADGRAVIGRLNAARLHGLQQFAQSLSDDERQHLAGALAHILQRDDVKACRPETETE